MPQSLGCFLGVTNNSANLPSGPCELCADMSADEARRAGDYYWLAPEVLNWIGLLGNCDAEIAGVAGESPVGIRHWAVSDYLERGWRARFDPRSAILQNSRKKPIVRRRCTYPGASVVNVIIAQAMSIITAAMIPKSIIDFVDGEFARS